MNSIPGPSNASSTIFTSQINTNASPSCNSSYYSNMEPDFKWMRKSVEQLISLVEEHFDEFYDKTLKKKVLWKKIAEEMRVKGYDCSSDECDKKWRNLKKSYIGVLQKQCFGDFSSKFNYFDKMLFLGREIDPLGMREQKINKAVQENMFRNDSEFPRIPYYEISKDDNFIWSDSAVHLLLDIILEHENIFRMNSDINNVWESIGGKMVNKGHDVTPLQCQRKWVNLLDGFRHHQAEGELTGKVPQWNFFARVRKVISTFNVPVTVPIESNLPAPNMKGLLTTPSYLREPPAKRRKRRRESPPDKHHKFSDEEEDDEENSHDTSGQFYSSLRKLQDSLKVDKRLSHMEMRMDVLHKFRAETKQSQTILENILGKLKQINKSFEIRKEQLLKEQEEEEAERLKHDRLILNHVDGDANIVDEAACRPAFFDVHDLANFQFMKAPKVELVEGNEEGIIIVEGLS